jgi:hypothetical protein
MKENAEMLKGQSNAGKLRAPDQAMKKYSDFWMWVRSPPRIQWDGKKIYAVKKREKEKMLHRQMRAKDKSHGTCIVWPLYIHTNLFSVQRGNHDQSVRGRTTTAW